MSNEGSLKWRVKLFMLGSDGEWQEVGLGYTHFDGPIFAIQSEEDPELELLSFEVGCEVYHRQRQAETILTWTTPDFQCFALSFLDPLGAKEVLSRICSIQGIDPNSVPYDDDDELLEVPDPKHFNLLEILSILTENPRDKIARAILVSGFLEKLKELFEHCEQQEKLDELHLIFEIYKCLVHLNSNEMLDALLEDDYYEAFFGALEYDSELPKGTLKLRELMRSVKQKNVLDVKDKEFENKLEFGFRLQFLKETALSRCIDDMTSNHITIYQLYNWKDIVLHFVSYEKIKDNLHQKLEEDKEGAFEFLVELSKMAKLCYNQIRVEFYEELQKSGIISLLHRKTCEETTKKQKLEKIVEFLGEVYNGMMEISPELVKKYLLSEDEKQNDYPIIKKLCSTFLQSENIGTQQEISKLIKLLLEPYEEDKYFLEICEVFYSEITKSFLVQIEKPNTQIEENRLCLCQIIEILSECVEKHQDRIRTFLTMNNVLHKTLNLLTLKDKPVYIMVLKFFRKVLERNDPFINKFIISHSLLEPVFRLFEENGKVENMIFSSVLALLEVVKKNKNKLLLDYISKLPSKHPLLKPYIQPLVDLHLQQQEAEKQ